MNKIQKKRFIRELTKSVADAAIAKIDKMPEHWTGIELRQYLADKFDEETAFYIRNHVNSKANIARLREYKNDVLIHNL